VRDYNIDAVTRWFYQGMPVDGLQRLLLYQPHHLTGYVMGLAALWLVGFAEDVTETAVALWAGILLGAAFLFSTFSANQPQLYVDVDRVKAQRLGLDLDVVYDTLQAYLGSAYVNDVTLYNRNWQVNVQADPDSRLRVEKIGSLEVRNAAGDRVPLRTLINVHNDSGPAVVNHYNLYPSAEINGTSSAVSASFIWSR